MTQLDRKMEAAAVPVWRVTWPIPRWIRLISWPDVIGVVAAALLTVGAAWSLQLYVTSVASSRIAAASIDLLQRQVVDSLTAADLDPPYVTERLDALAAHLGPLLEATRSEDTGISHVNIYARDGTVIYTDQPDQESRRGWKVQPSRVPRLADALGGLVNTRLVALESSENAGLNGLNRFAAEEALVIFGPFVVEDEVLAAYEIYHDPTPIHRLRVASWSLVVGVFTVFFLGYVRRRQLQARRLMQQAAESDALRKLDRLKSELLSTVAHELRTPLSLVHGYAELLTLTKRTFEPVQVREMAGEIHRGSTTMQRIVEDLLDFGLIEEGRLRLQRTQADLNLVVGDAVRSLTAHPGSERIVLHCPSTPVMADVDKARIGQVVTNLATNALRYAPTGPIQVRLVKTGATQAVIEVRDTGPGMSPEVVSRIWEMFYRAPESVDSPIRGAGIGLPLVKALAEAHGGRVEIESTLGRGSTFRVHLPCTNSSADAATAVSMAQCTP